MAGGSEVFKVFGSILINTADADKSLSKTDNKLKLFAGKLGSGILTAAKFAGGVIAAVGGIAVAAGKTTAEFEAQMSNVKTLLTGTADEIDAKAAKYGEIVKQVARDTGLQTGNLTDGLYQVVSAYGDVDDAAEIMAIAAKSAAAGNAQTADAVGLLSAVTKGYGDISAEANQKAADLAFTTVRLGQTSFPELAASMGKVIPLASTMKVSQEELFGAMATLTGVTGSTAEVSTQLKATIQGLLQPSNNMTAALKKLGYENGQAAIESLGLQGTLEALKESVNGDELAFAGLFSSVEAKTAVLALAGAQAEDFTNKTAEMYQAAGAAQKAFETQTNNLKGTLAKLKQSVNTATISLGERLLPVAQSLADWLLDAMPAIETAINKVFDFVGLVVNKCVEFIATLKSATANWAAEHKTTIAAVQNVISEIYAFATRIIESVVQAVRNFGAWASAFWAQHGNSIVSFITTTLSQLMRLVNAAVDLVQSVVRAFGSWASSFWAEHGKTIMAIVEPLLNSLKTLFSATLSVITSLFQVFAAVFRGDWQAAWNGIVDIFTTVWNTIVTLVKNLLTAIIEALGARLTELYNAGRAILENVHNGLKAVFDTIVKYIGDLVGKIIGKLGEKATDLYNAGRSILDNVFNGIKSVWDSISTWVSDKVSWLTDKLSFWRNGQSEMSSNGSHATGLAYVPFDGYRAILHRGERVLTREEAAEYNRGESGNGGDTYNQTNNFYNCSEMSEADAAAQERELLRKLREGF